MASKASPRQARLRRHLRVRRKVEGSELRPRLCVFRSLNYIYAQVIDDGQGCTLVSASSREAEVKQQTGKKAEQARSTGLLLAQRAVEAGITQVTFDRGGYKYHGRVKALAEAAREGGLKF